MHEDALANADPFVNFLQFDANGDRALTPDEVLVTIVKPQQGNFGQAGNSVTLELDGEELTVHYADVYLEPPGLRPPFDPRAPNVGVAAHEMAHLVLRATDLAGGDLFSTMSNTGWAGHLDPIHKLLSGWVVPDAIEISALATAQVGLRAVEVGGEGVLVYDRTRPAEVLLIENRWMSPTNYDGQDVPGHFGVGGVAVWHAAFDLVHRRWDPPSAHIRVQRALVQPSPADPLIASWGDGTPAISIDTTSTSPSQTMNLSITKLP